MINFGKRDLQRLCTYLFPEQYSTPPLPNTSYVNTVYGGWNIEADHLILTAGKSKHSLLIIDGLLKSPQRGRMALHDDSVPITSTREYVHST